MAQPAAFPARDVRVAISMDGAFAAVHEEFELHAPVEHAALRALTHACATLGPITVEFESRSLLPEGDRRGPWLQWSLPTDEGPRAPARLVVDYVVELRGGRTGIPVLHPAAPLTDDARVSMVVRGLGPESDVTLPRLAPTADEWRATLPALPSWVVVQGRALDAQACEVPPARTPNGLELRVWTLVAVMAVWIPVYFWWFGRRRSSAP